MDKKSKLRKSISVLNVTRALLLKVVKESTNNNSNVELEADLN